METPTETKKEPALSNKVVIIAAAAVIVALAVVAFLLLSGRKETDLGIGSATEAKVMLDQDSLQAAFDEALRNAAEGNIGLKYKNDAYSSNGTDFECYIVNSEANKYDMFLTIYADAELTDQIFLSQLVPPGSGFENITLDHALDAGSHTVFVALTQVDTNEDGQQVIKHQTMHTMDFHVTE